VCELKEVLQRALICVKKKKHFLLMTHYAKFMYLQGEVEKGRTTFQAILQNFPKRKDIWAVYLDMETKHG